LLRRRFHSILTLVSVGIGMAVMYASFIMVQGVAQGIEGSINRMGADIVVIPRTGEAALTEQILFSGRPVNNYMDKEVVQKIKEIPGVEKVSAQFFTQTLNESCCSLGNVTRIIGFDPDTDFVLKPLLETIPGVHGPLQNDQIIAGGQTNIPLGGKILVLGKVFNVVGQLQPVGGGTDTTLFVSIDQARTLAAGSDALQHYWENGKNPDQLVSAVLVKVNNPIGIESVAKGINGIERVETAAASEILRTSKDQLSILSRAVGVIAGVLWVVVLLGLAGRFASFVIERKMEFGLLRALGARHMDIFKIVMGEALLTTLVGGLIGLMVGYFLVFQGSSLISQETLYPFLLPSWKNMGMVALLTLAVSMLTGSLASWYPAYRCASLDPVKAISQGELE